SQPRSGHLKMPWRAPKTTWRGKVVRTSPGSMSPLGCQETTMPPPFAGTSPRPVTVTRRKNARTMKRRIVRMARYAREVCSFATGSADGPELLVGLFHVLAHDAREDGRVHAVDEAVIEGRAHVHHLADGELAVVDHGLLLHGAERDEDGHAAVGHER